MITTERWLGIFLVVAWILPVSGVCKRQGRRDGDCKVYVYLDEHGRPVRSTRLERVPPEKRSTMVVVDDCFFARQKRQYSYVQDKTFGDNEAGGDADIEQDDGAPFSRAALYKKLYRKALRRRGWLVFCLVVVLACWIALLVAAWRVGLAWFLVTLIGALWFPPVVLLFIVFHWHEAKVPFLVYLAAFAGIFLVLLL